MTPDHCSPIPIHREGTTLGASVQKTTRERECTFTRWTVVSLILVPTLGVDERNRFLADEALSSPYAPPPCSILSVSCIHTLIRKSTSISNEHSDSFTCLSFSLSSSTVRIRFMGTARDTHDGTTSVIKGNNMTHFSWSMNTIRSTIAVRFSWKREIPLIPQIPTPSHCDTKPAQKEH